MRWVTTSLFFVVGVANSLPVVGSISAGRLQTLYGVALADPNLVILMRHRAVLFGVVGGLLVTSAFIETLRPLAAAVGLVSMLSFLLIALLVGDTNAELRRIAIVDLAASAVLIGAWLIDALDRARRSAG